VGGCWRLRRSSEPSTVGSTASWLGLVTKRRHQVAKGELVRTCGLNGGDIGHTNDAGTDMLSSTQASGPNCSPATSATAPGCLRTFGDLLRVHADRAQSQNARRNDRGQVTRNAGSASLPTLSAAHPVIGCAVRDGDPFVADQAHSLPGWWPTAFQPARSSRN
jgi:hypothetical protein